jgi:hypothetical protein
MTTLQRLETSLQYWSELASRDLASGASHNHALDKAAKLAVIVSALRQNETR